MKKSYFLKDDKTIKNYINFLEDLVNQSTKLLVETMNENIKIKEVQYESCRFKSTRKNKQKK